MSRLDPQFRAHLKFTFREHGEDRRRKFIFPDNGLRRVPMSIEGVDGLHTVCLSIDGPREFNPGDEVEISCNVIWPEGLSKATVQGAKFELWDAGFFATGTVLERFDSAWSI